MNEYALNVLLQFSQMYSQLKVSCLKMR